ncbi:PepSY-associated TM region [Flagellimonas pacifica]|uniref:PepSY-associated TM region n=2 Tax=Flagellimonas pacifica TaxID=1247520 RepID=A0A285MHH4_9FLAO|nr:PepSY-associated TM region [Allomuricauda parva]
MGATLCLLFLIISVSGLLLGWKKNSNGLILPKSYYGSSTEFKDWLPLGTLQHIACTTLHDSIDANLSLELSRIDVRSQNGMVKFVFKEQFWEVQIDGATGKVLHVDQRFSDLIENIHDGSVLDHYFHTKGVLKLAYTSIMGASLLIFTVTGFWLWYGPKVMRRSYKGHL